MKWPPAPVFTGLLWHPTTQQTWLEGIFVGDLKAANHRNYDCSTSWLDPYCPNGSRSRRSAAPPISWNFSAGSSFVPVFDSFDYKGVFVNINVGKVQVNWKFMILTPRLPFGRSYVTLRVSIEMLKIPHEKKFTSSNFTPYWHSVLAILCLQTFWMGLFQLSLPEIVTLKVNLSVDIYLVRNY